MNIKIRFDYDELGQMGKIFATQGSEIAGINRKIKAAQATLEGGDWIGKGAKAFSQEMNNDVNPSMKRLEKAMEEAARITKQISKIAKDAEGESSKHLASIKITTSGPGSGDVVIS